MMSARHWPIEASILVYILAFVPNIVVTRLLVVQPIPALGRPLNGLELLPASLFINMLMTFAFIVLSGWHKDANGLQWGGVRLPWPRRATWLSGMATALVLFTVPLSVTFRNVSIPFIQLLMRGDIVILAPLVDALFGRRVHWWSWLALAMVIGAMALTLDERGGLNLPPLAIVMLVLYTLGFFARLAIITKVAKTSDPATMRGYFVEEKLVALPLSLAILALISALSGGNQSGDLARGFVGIWSLGVIWPLLGIGLTLTIVSVMSVIILLNPRENTYCVPLERSASLFAGVLAAEILAHLWGQHAPSAAELQGAAILIAAIVLLSLAPRLLGKAAKSV